MPRIKYKFNHESLSFDKVTLGIKALLLRVLGFLMGSIVVAVIYWAIFASLFDTPREKALKREVAQMNLQYDLINREMVNIEAVLDDLQKTDDNLYRTIFEAEPVPSTLREGGTGAVARLNQMDSYSNSKLVVETIEKLDKIKNKAFVQSKSFEELVSMANAKAQMMKCIPAIQPISNNDLTRTASGFGLRIHPFYKITKFHYGMDFTAPSGTDVYSTGDGVVAEVNSSKRGLGNNVVVDHGFGYVTVYGHLQSFNVKKGQKVSRGDVIAYVGNTGMSLAPHLHYEVKVDGVPVDPINFYFSDLSPEDYQKIIEIASKTGQSFD